MNLRGREDFDGRVRDLLVYMGLGEVGALDPQRVAVEVAVAVEASCYPPDMLCEKVRSTLPAGHSGVEFALAYGLAVGLSLAHERG